ncbi:MAG: hypothetical protein M9894_35570 [Planctomycetes bacterium]|nr:hypothetical protein [Planctomycetota bacterium]
MGRRAVARSGSLGGVGLAGALIGALLVGAARVPAQDEMDRQDLPERPDDFARPRPADVAPVRSEASGRPVPDQGARKDPRFIPEVPEFDPRDLPGDAPPPAAPPSFWEAIKLRHRGRVRLGAGHDTNVFRAARRRTGDGFGNADAKVELLATFPQGAQVFAEFGGQTLMYFERDQADEHFASAFVEVFQPTTWFDFGVQNAFEFSRQNLLDDNGDLFPRGRFGSLDEEVRAYVIARPHADLALEAGAAYRWKDYDENRGVDSLDYEEVRLDASVSWRLSRDPRTRLKLKYRFRRRDYREFRARARDGTIGDDEPHLDLHRHQLNLTYFQDLRLGGQQLRLVGGLGLAYNRDLHKNDRSYREGSTSLQLEWWPKPEWTRLETRVRALGRDFLVRQPPGRGGRLHHRLVDVSVGVWQRLHEEWPLALYGNVSFTGWRSGDPLEAYQRFVFEAGLEASW